MVALYRLYVTAFTIGVSVMVVEMIGFGVIAPHFGTSLAVSTNLIGVILASLALGYFLGGRLADTWPKPATLAYLLVGATFSVGALYAFKDLAGGWMSETGLGIVRSSLVALTIVFGPLNVFLGAATSLVLKLGSTRIAALGTRVGLLYGSSVLGSVAGTIVTGHFLIPAASTDVILLSAGLVLLCAAFWVMPRWKIQVGLCLVFYLCFWLLGAVPYPAANERGVAGDGAILIDRSKFTKLADVNTFYSRIQIYEGVDKLTSRVLRLMRVNKELHSGMFIDSNELVFTYSQFNTLAGHFHPAAKKALLIGGGGYSYAKYFLGDTPLFDAQKTWRIGEKLYGNDSKLSLPFLIAASPRPRDRSPELVATAPAADPTELEGIKSSIEARSQPPGASVLLERAVIADTGLPGDKGYVHIHETKEDGTPGRVVSPDVFLHQPRNIIGHSDLFGGERRNFSVPLDRSSREGEVLYAMLHRDNGNGRFDPILVDGYSKIRRLDVVEIDPKTTELAERYLGLNASDPRLKIFHEDGRTFINATKEKYDIIYIDAFRSFYSVPFQLTTQEATRRLYEALSDKGVVVANIPSALRGPKSRFFQSELATYKAVFPEVRVYAVISPTMEYEVQNLILIGFQSKAGIRDAPNDDPAMNKRLLQRWHGNPEERAPVLTDDFAPVDFYTSLFADLPTL